VALYATQLAIFLLRPMISEGRVVTIKQEWDKKIEVADFEYPAMGRPGKVLSIKLTRAPMTACITQDKAQLIGFSRL
jgi:hypothetical protein